MSLPSPRCQERRFCLVEAASGETRAEVERWLARLREAGGEVVRIESGAPGAGRECLGRTLDAVLFDATRGFDPDAFARACGAVRGGGVFVLMTPPLDHWHRLPDRLYQRIDAWGHESGPRGFLPRLVTHLRRSGACRSVEPACLPSPLPGNAPGTGAGLPGALTPDQRKALRRLEETENLPETLPVLVAPRGRGKSTVLGIHAARLQASGRRVVVTAPSKRAAGALLEAAASLQAAVEFRSPDRLRLESVPAGHWLIIDEAAAIPLELLQSLLGAHRCILASTIEGYEGTGRGLWHRLLKTVHGRAELIPLFEPVRWAAGDPLEDFLGRLLLFDDCAALEQCPEGEACQADGLRHEELSRRQLAQEASLLREVFVLLRDAHYRTRPFDLRFLLDAPNLRLFASRDGERLVAVALVLEEGGLSGGLDREILYGKRRVRGHLLPQSVAYHLATPQWLRWRGWRISRIAVHEACQGMGVGSALLGEVRRRARAEHRTWLGVSYGASPALLRFWYRNRFVPLRLGLQPETASGALPLLMVQPLDDAAGALVSELHRRFLRDLPVQAAHHPHPPDRELMRMLCPLPVAPCPKGVLAAHDLERVEVFARTGNLHDHLPALLRWRGSVRADMPCLDALAQTRDVMSAAVRMGCRGRREFLHALQAEVSERLG